MKAEVLSIGNVLKFKDSKNGDVQFVLPRFQRAYVWEEKNWETLLEDICEIHKAEDKNTNHFMGAIVAIDEGENNEHLQTFALVDGQQRLITISVLLCALANKSEKCRLHPQFRSYLENMGHDADNRFKVLPTERDRDALKHLISPGDTSDKAEESRINGAYVYYETKIAGELKNLQVDDLFDTVLNKLTLVMIIMDQNEQPHQIFARLNAESVRLSLPDLVRNYIAMRLPERSQGDIFDNYWSPIETFLKEQNRITGRSGELTAFLRHYLSRFSHNITSDYEDLAYAAFRRHMEKEELHGVEEFTEEIKRLHRYARHYRRLLRPDHEEDPVIHRRLHNLNRLGQTTTYPLLLYMYDNYKIGEINRDTFLEILRILENYLVRFFLGKEQSNRLNKYFLKILKRAKDDKINICEPDNFKAELVRDYYPADRRIYDVTKLNGFPESGNRDKIVFILEEINHSFENGNGEVTQNGKLTIEHIMPKKVENAPESWKIMLGEDWREIHKSHLDRLGNLTIMPRNENSRLKNEGYHRKRNYFRSRSNNLLMNSKYFKDSRRAKEWNANEIQKRTKWLVGIALNEIWKPLDRGHRKQNVDYTRSKPKSYSLQSNKYDATDWKSLIQDVTQRVVDLTTTDDFTNIAAEFPDKFRRDRGYKKHEFDLGNGWFVDDTMSANDAFAFLKDLTSSADLGFRINIKR